MHNVRLGSKYLAIADSVHRVQKIAVVHFTTIPCELNTTKQTNQPQKVKFFQEIRPCTNNVVYVSFEVFITFLCVFLSVFRVFVR